MKRKGLVLAIRLLEPIELRLNALTETTGRTKTALAREAILEFIDDLEDFYLAEARTRRERPCHPYNAIEQQSVIHVSDFSS